MLSREDNERITRVSRGTPMGEVMRRYWQPILMVSEISEPDGAPVRVRLLGEDLIAFRDTNGKVGLVDAYCPHRRAPMFYGRNEDCGLRCVYHGWKFDTNGNCTDLPTEPASSKMKDHIKIASYPTFEGGGLIWAYLGPKDQMPEPPDYEWMRAPSTHCHMSKTYEHCNWVQALEGGLDTAHSSFAHNNGDWADNELRQRDKAPRLDVEKTDYGYTYISFRKASAEETYVRVYQYLMPHQQARGNVTQAGGRSNQPKMDGHIWVPIDDESTFVYNWACGIDKDAPISLEFFEKFEKQMGRGHDDHIPGTFKLKKNLTNDYLIDRELQKNRSFYTGIVGINTQDFALQEGMGPIVDRSQEKLGSTDKAIIAMRNLLLEATRDVAAGKAPRGTDPKTHSQVRAFDALIPADADWHVAMAEDLRAKW